MLDHVILMLKTLQWFLISFNMKVKILRAACKTLTNLKLSTIQPSSPHLSPLSSPTTPPLTHSTPGTLGFLGVPQTQILELEVCFYPKVLPIPSTKYTLPPT